MSDLKSSCKINKLIDKRIKGASKCDHNNSSSRKLIPIKIIEEPALYLANLDLQNFAQTGAYAGRGRVDLKSFELKSKFKPANFSGPPQLEELNGKCFEFLNLKWVSFLNPRISFGIYTIKTLISNSYKWVVCPFQNVTQYEQTFKYKPYRGILG